MSLLPGEILSPTDPLGKADAKGVVLIDKNWWLLIYALCHQVLPNGGNTAATEQIDLALFKPKGTDTERAGADLAQTIATQPRPRDFNPADLVLALSSLPNPQGRIAALEQRVSDLETLLQSRH